MSFYAFLIVVRNSKCCIISTYSIVFKSVAKRQADVIASRIEIPTSLAVRALIEREDH